MSNSHIYILSGLGVDRKVFSKINFEGLQVIHIDWIAPLKKETMAAYAERLSLQINDEQPILVGLSFGGMMAMEIAKIIKVQKIVLLASAKGEYELPFLYKIIGALKLNYVLPKTFLKQHNRLVDYFFGISSKEDKLMLKQILQDTDVKFLKWAINQILNWKNNVVHSSVIHIHGNQDRIIPIRNIKPTYVIENAGHFMTMTHAREIELLLKKVL